MSPLDNVIIERMVANLLPRGPHMSVGMIGSGRFSCVACGRTGDGPHAYFALQSGARHLLHPECFQAWRRVTASLGDGAARR
jgi:hypothetical protein